MFDEYQLGLYEGKMNERERIVALLDNVDWFEKNLVVTLGPEMTEDGTTETIIDIPAILALIKGEVDA
jgi:hypothetical protein